MIDAEKLKEVRHKNPKLMRNIMRAQYAMRLYHDLVSALKLEEKERQCVTEKDYERLVTEIMEKVKKD